MKKAFSILLVLAMVFSIPLTVFAGTTTLTENNDIKLTGEYAMFNGDQFEMYDPLAGMNIFNLSEGYFSVNTNAKSVTTGSNLSIAALQYRDAMTGDYVLTYQEKPSESMNDSIWTYFYWQTHTESGRSFKTCMRPVGFALTYSITAEKITFRARLFEKAQGAGSWYDTLAEGSAADTAEIFKDLPEGTSNEFKISLKWAAGKLTASATLVADPTKTTGDVIWDLSGQTDILNAVTPEGFGICWLNAGAQIGQFALQDLSKSETAPTAIALKSTGSALLNGDKFLMYDPNSSVGASGDTIFHLDKTTGYFTRTADWKAVTSDGEGNQQTATAGVLQYKTPASGDYSLSYQLKVNEARSENLTTLFAWREWADSGRAYQSSQRGTGLALQTVISGDNITFAVLTYKVADGGYAKYSTVAEGSAAATSALLTGKEGGTEIVTELKWESNKLTVSAHLLADATVTTGDVIFDLSSKSDIIAAANANPSGFAFLMNADCGGVGSFRVSTVQNETTPADTTDYAGMLNETFAWNGDIAATEDNFMLYSTGASQVYTISDGWFVRTGNDSINTVAAGETATSPDAYASMQYKGVMDGGDYRLSFSVKFDELNRGRFNVMTRWEDKDDTSNVSMKSQTGYRIYFFTEANKVYVRCYQTTGSYIQPIEATKANYGKLDLTGLAANTELAVTIAMKDNYVVTEIHVASDPSKTGGVIAFDLSENAELLAAVDKTQGFVIVDSANELKVSDTQFGVASASYGNIKLWAASEPTKASSSGDDFDPDDIVTTAADEDETTAVSGDETTASDDAAETTTVAEDTEKSGCSSSISMATASLLLTAVVGGAVVLKKKKED